LATSVLHIKRAPERPPAASPDDPRYFDERDLEDELRRTFQICHECRMCVSYCGSFPELFARVDRDIEQHGAVGVEALTDADFTVVTDECWQCKLCYIKCPYTKDEGASEVLDFPRLMAREKANRAKRNGVSFVDQVLGEPHLLGAMGAKAPAISNLVHASRLVRKVAERVTGVSAEFPLPKFATETFPAWFGKHEPKERAGEAGTVVLFATCYTNHHLPGVGRAAVRVLEHVGYRVEIIEETCCGMPNLDGGDVGGFVAKVRDNVAKLLPQVKAGAPVLVPSPTCGYTLKKEWAEYVDEPNVRRVADATVDLMEFLEQLRRAKRLPKEFERGLGNVAYHGACHLRAQKIGYPGARVLGKGPPDTEVTIVERCSAVDGTWGMKAAHYETGRKYAEALTREMSADDIDLVVTDCPLSALRISKETEQKPIHPIEALARAYGLDG
jgi:glycerol-3-phosphate dehydrogenase subunit C